MLRDDFRVGRVIGRGLDAEHVCEEFLGDDLARRPPVVQFVVLYGDEVVRELRGLRDVVEDDRDRHVTFLVELADRLQHMELVV